MCTFDPLTPPLCLRYTVITHYSIYNNKIHSPFINVNGVDDDLLLLLQIVQFKTLWGVYIVFPRILLISNRPGL